MADRLDFERLRGFCDRQTDRQTDGQTDICDCRVAFATEKVANAFLIVLSTNLWTTSFYLLPRVSDN